MGLFKNFIAKIKGTNEFATSDWVEIEKDLISSDLGPNLTSDLIAQAKKIKSQSAEEAVMEILSTKLSKQSRDPVVVNPMTTILIVGVNGTGKTTSVAKLGAYYSNLNKSIVLAAGDTFRAAAVDQLKTWGKRLGLIVISGRENSDPASVAFDAAKYAMSIETDFLIIDTAGRLHNKEDLMLELGKVKRVVDKVSPVNEVLLVIDATTGQNGLAQARVFTQSVDVTGIILTKLDGSAKGGIALAIESELGIPIKWIGTGESDTDFAPFNAERYLQGLIT